MKIKAAVLYGPNLPFVIEELDLEAPHENEVLVRIGASGVCHSDYHLITGATKHAFPVVAGHEGAGVVEAVGPGVTHTKPGDHVVLNWAPSCDRCFYCLDGKPNLCDTFVGPIWAGVMLDGTSRLSKDGETVYHFSGTATFAEYAVVPKESCIPVRKDVPLQVAALVGCAVATGVGAAMYTTDIRPGQTAVVYGCGGVGLNILQGAKLAGASKIIAIDSSMVKMELAHEFGATHFLLAGEQTRSQVYQLTDGRGGDHVFEAIGIPAVQTEALRVTRPGGTMVLVGLSSVKEGTNLPGAFIARQEKTIKGSYYGSVNTWRDFPLFLDMYAEGRLKLDELVTQEYTLDRINEAYDAMLTGDVARGVIVF